jgi:hypothetical protein
MSDSHVVLATGTVSRAPELQVIGAGTRVCVLQIAVEQFRCLGDGHLETPRYLTATVTDDQAVNCVDRLCMGRSIALEAELVQGGQSAEGVASAVYFVGSASRAAGQSAQT